MKSQPTGKTLDAGKDWGQEEKGTTEDEMVGWHHWLNGYEFEQTLGESEGQGSLTCCSPWGHKELDTTEWWTAPGQMLCLPSYLKQPKRYMRLWFPSPTQRTKGSHPCRDENKWDKSNNCPPLWFWKNSQAMIKEAGTRQKAGDSRLMRYYWKSRVGNETGIHGKVNRKREACTEGKLQRYSEGPVKYSAGYQFIGVREELAKVRKKKITQTD